MVRPEPDAPTSARWVPTLRAAHAVLTARNQAEPIRALFSQLFEGCAAARGCPATGAVAVAPHTRQALVPIMDQLTTDTAAWDGRTLGTLYEALLDPPARRQAGIYYTPAPIVERILDAALDPLVNPLPPGGEGRVRGESRATPPVIERGAAIRSLGVLDSACGAGYFLVAAAERIARALAAADPQGRDAAAAMATACRQVYGADSDPVACDLARYSLYLAAGGRVPLDDLHIYCGDALAALPAGWDSFDAVVGNPPYVAHRAQGAADKAARQTTYCTARGQYDLSVLFVERGLALLRPGGTLGYILPNKFMAAEYGAALRALLAQETSLLRLEDLSQDGCFPDAAIYPVILVARKAPPAADHAVTLAGPARPPGKLPQAALCGLPGGILPAVATPALLDLAARIAQQPGRLPLRAIRCGIARSGHARATLSAAAYAALTPAARAEYLPLLQAQDVGAYTVRPPAAPRYLPRTAMSGAKAAAFARPAVLVPGIARRLRAAYSPGGTALGRVYAIAAGATPYDPCALLILFNSRLLAWYYRFLFWPVHLASGYLRFNAPYLAQLPLPPPDAPLLAALADVARHLTATGAATHLDVDAAVCALYGVTPAELADAEAELALLTAGE